MYTLSALTSPPSPKEYIALRQNALKSLLKSVPAIDTEESELVDDIEAFMREAGNGWLEMEWYQNIQPAQESGDEAEEIDADEIGHDEEEGSLMASKAPRKREKQKSNPVDISAAPKRAFGTMMTDATDWLSDDRRTDYRQWKAKIIRQIERIEKEGQRA